MYETILNIFSVLLTGSVLYLFHKNNSLFALGKCLSVSKIFKHHTSFHGFKILNPEEKQTKHWK